MSDVPKMLFRSHHESVQPVKVYARFGGQTQQRCEQCLHDGRQTAKCRKRALYWHGVYLCREHAEQLAVILRRLQMGNV